MKRKKYLIGIDTETTNGIITEDGKLDLSQSLVYDIGWQVTDRNGKVYEKKSFVVAEIFLDKDLMSQAYYAEKIPQYWEEIKSGKRVLTSFSKIRYAFLLDRKKWKCKAVFAHNAFFDYTALNNTLRYLTGSKYRYFFPYALEIWDTLIMSRQVFGKTKTYSLFCEKYGYKTKHKHPQNRLTAEILYRYLTKNNDFLEAHTGLEDVEIETEILVACLKSKKKIRRLLFQKQ